MAGPQFCVHRTASRPSQSFSDLADRRFNGEPARTATQTAALRQVRSAGLQGHSTRQPVQKHLARATGRTFENVHARQNLSAAPPAAGQFQT